MTRGIDVAVFQGSIDWDRVKASGIDVAMIKATQGRALSSNSYLFTDRYFSKNIESACKAGIRCGVYHYLTAKTVKEAQTEANHFIETIKPYKDRISLWAAVDVEEDKYLPKNKNLLTDIVRAFCEAVRSSGFAPMVYANRNYLVSRMNDISDYPLWLALWRNKDNIPDGYTNMKIWQWGAEKVDGIANPVDSNFGYFDPPVSDGEYADSGIRAGDKVKVIHPILYGTKNRRFMRWYSSYDVIQVTGDRVVIGRGNTVTAAVSASNLQRI